jgi:hypothetical protein
MRFPLAVHRPATQYCDRTRPLCPSTLLIFVTITSSDVMFVAYLRRFRVRELTYFLRYYNFFHVNVGIIAFLEINQYTLFQILLISQLIITSHHIYKTLSSSLTFQRCSSRHIITVARISSELIFESQCVPTMSFGHCSTNSVRGNC